MKQLSQLARSPFYLWIVGVYPILHLYVTNFGLVDSQQVVPTIAAMLIATTAAFLAANHFTRDRHKNAFFLAIASLYFSTSGHLYSLFVMPSSLLVWNIVSAIVVIAIAFACLRLIPRRAYARFTSTFNLVAVALLMMQLFSLLSVHLDAQGYADVNSVYNQAWQEKPAVEKVMDSPERPDIYYIIPDAYPSDARLLSEIDYDNSDFTQALQERGFVIAPHARSNYTFTVLSLPSILNMRYFEDNPSQFSNLDYLQLSTANNEVAHRLQQLGYTHVQLLSGFLYISPNADIVRDYSPAGTVDLSAADSSLPAQDLAEHDQEKGAAPKNLHIRQQFAPLYLYTTALRIVRSQLEDLFPQASTTPYKRKTAERFLATIDSIDRIVAMPEATFTIMHLLEPYSYVTFNENGDIITNNTSPTQDEYLAELPFVNSQFLRLIDKILEGSQNPPVIIFQADHGCHCLRSFSGRADDNTILYDAYASYYLPRSEEFTLPSSFTLVNSFPWVLNHVFGIDLELQENRIFHVEEGYVLFGQREITAEALRRN